MKNVYLKCKGIYPAGCVTAIEHALYSQGIAHFEYDVSNSHAKVVFDETKVRLEDLLQKIDEIGYKVDVLGIDEIDLET